MKFHKKLYLHRTIEHIISKKEYVTCLYVCTAGQKKGNTPIYFNKNYRKEMKLVPIIMDYCLL